MKKSFSFLFFLVVLLFFGALGWFYSVKAEWHAPQLTITPIQDQASADTIFTVTARDADSGLKSLRVIAAQDGKNQEILTVNFPEGTTEMSEQFTLSQKNLKNAPLTLMVAVRDRSWHHFGQGNKAAFVKEMHIDTKPPVISILSGVNSVAQGGTGLLTFRSNEELYKSGVQIGDYFFPAYRYQKDTYLCFFALPYKLDPKTVTPVLRAQDRADNIAKVSFPFRALPKKFRQDTLKISDNFLQSKMGQFADLYPEAKTPLDLFIKVNNDLRAKNIVQVFNIGKKTVPQILWKNTFTRLPGSANMAQYGDARTYLYHDKPVDYQTHMGVDLASVTMAPIPAGNTGRVVWAQALGIYGNVVVIDHGFGLQSLYSHMSEIAVQKGQVVQRGDIIGKTGKTGLAGGDHLHFGIVISGLQVQPIEWWDARWIKNNIVSKLPK